MEERQEERVMCPGTCLVIVAADGKLFRRVHFGIKRTEVINNSLQIIFHASQVVVFCFSSEDETW